jgi:hypothetical protein
VRVINVRKSAEPEAEADADEEDRFYPEEGSAEGCASGDCLPDSPPAPEPQAAPPLAISGRDNPALAAGERWRAAVETVKVASIRHGAALSHGRLLWLRAGEVGLAYAPTAAFHRGMVTGSSGRPLVEKALSEHFGRPVKLVVEETTGEVTTATLSIAEQDTQARTAHQHNTEGKVRSHPAIRAVLKFLGGEIEHIQVLEAERPLTSPAVESPEESP